jgi:thiamine-monophosphate kinase
VLSLQNINAANFEALLSGGDDYELMFTANPDKVIKINTLSRDLNVKISKIGKLTEDLEVGFIDQDGAMLTLSSNGFRHF